ncbi:ras-related protein Rab-32 isoform X2 [Diabrotica undecimpunctata]|uniref:ras-related protein Rab-32 isoform X2 n=1 Tax=Diabrotica undecimpunctata TaxID=50387 RepID=UPI003B634C78
MLTMDSSRTSTPKNSRRTRRERTKRRERYRSPIEKNHSVFCDDSGSGFRVLTSSNDSNQCGNHNNNVVWSKFKQKTTKMSNANQSTSKPKDHLYKILVIGDLGTGKTSIIKRYVHRFFTQHYRATIGVDFALKVLNWDENTLIRLQLWDIAGQERYGNMTRVYYKEAVGAFIVFDVTRKPTFESVANWKADLDSKVQLPDGSKIPCVLLANKCDQQKEGIASSPSKMEEYCRENGFHAWYETSAKDNINIDEAARSLVEKILAYDSVLNSDSKRSSDQFSLRRDSDGNSANRRSCSC